MKKKQLYKMIHSLFEIVEEMAEDVESLRDCINDVEAYCDDLVDADEGLRQWCGDLSEEVGNIYNELEKKKKKK